MALFKSKRCVVCGCEVSLRHFDIGKKVNGKQYCSDCYYCAYKRMSASTLPNMFMNKKFSIKYANMGVPEKSRCYDIEIQPSYTPMTYVFHALFLYAKSFNTTELICVENVTGRLFHVIISISRCQDTGPDAGSDTYSAQIIPITEMQLQIFLNAVPYNERRVFDGLNPSNGKAYLNVSYF